MFAAVLLLLTLPVALDLPFLPAMAQGFSLVCWVCCLLKALAVLVKGLLAAFWLKLKEGLVTLLLLLLFSVLVLLGAGVWLMRRREGVLGGC